MCVCMCVRARPCFEHFHMYWIKESFSRLSICCLEKKRKQTYMLLEFDKQKLPAVILSTEPNTLCSIWNWFPFSSRVLTEMPGLNSLSSWYLNCLVLATYSILSVLSWDKRQFWKIKALTFSPFLIYLKNL